MSERRDKIRILSKSKFDQLVRELPTLEGSNLKREYDKLERKAEKLRKVLKLAVTATANRGHEFGWMGLARKTIAEVERE